MSKLNLAPELLQQINKIADLLERKYVDREKIDVIRESLFKRTYLKTLTVYLTISKLENDVNALLQIVDVLIGEDNNIHVLLNTMRDILERYQ